MKEAEGGLFNLHDWPIKIQMEQNRIVVKQGLHEWKFHRLLFFPSMIISGALLQHVLQFTIDRCRIIAG